MAAAGPSEPAGAPEPGRSRSKPCCPRSEGCTHHLLEGAAATALLEGNAASWIHDAGNPYWEWLWGSSDEARRQLAVWLTRPSSELSRERAVLVAEAGRVLGGYLALGGRELRGCRKADFLELFQCARRAPGSGLEARLRQAAGLFAEVSDDEFYLSRLGLLPAARGRGLGRLLVQAWLDAGEARGFRRFRLDVAVDNVAAIRLYEAAGLARGPDAGSADLPFRYCAMTAELA